MDHIADGGKLVCVRLKSWVFIDGVCIHCIVEMVMIYQSKMWSVVYESIAKLVVLIGIMFS